MCVSSLLTGTLHCPIKLHLRNMSSKIRTGGSWATKYGALLSAKRCVLRASHTQGVSSLPGSPPLSLAAPSPSSSLALDIMTWVRAKPLLSLISSLGDAIQPLGFKCHLCGDYSLICSTNPDLFSELQLCISKCLLSLSTLMSRVRVKVARLCPTLCHSMDYIVHGIPRPEHWTR